MSDNKLYDLLWKKGESKEGKAQWERVGIMLEKEDGKKSVKLDLIPAAGWDGWLVVSERKEKDKQSQGSASSTGNDDIPF